MKDSDDYECSFICVHVHLRFVSCVLFVLFVCTAKGSEYKVRGGGGGYESWEKDS
jgi:hypothetical protein